jgi:4-hydroxybenzoate polyprenyltransferase
MHAALVLTIRRLHGEEQALPDVERDRLVGVDGLTHRLGVRRRLRLLWILLGGTIILMALTLLLGRNP